tara:strand:- start:533 stop:1207 length:675 start_codon:yes stop_codon:yes gene_type:complete
LTELVLHYERILGVEGIFKRMSPRAKNDGDTPGWPKRMSAHAVQQGKIFLSLSEELWDMDGKQAIWSALNADQKMFMMEWTQTAGNKTEAMQRIGKGPQWFSNQMVGRSGAAFYAITRDIKTFQESLPFYLEREIVEQSLLQTARDLMGSDPAVARSARKEGWDLIKAKMKPSPAAPPPAPAAEVPLTIFKPREVTAAEQENYDKRGTPDVVEVESGLERDDDP